MFTNAEERKFLELDEAIEAIDTVIEYKNEIICGHDIHLRDHTSDEKVSNNFKAIFPRM